MMDISSHISIVTQEGFVVRKLLLMVVLGLEFYKRNNKVCLFFKIKRCDMKTNGSVSVKLK